MNSPTDAPAPARIGWADIAKGASIVLVVMHHATTKQYDLSVPAALAPIADGWTTLTHALKPVRMPLFFLVSGFFAANAVHRPWPRVTRRISTSAYLYVVWLLLLAAFTLWERELPMNRTQNLGELALDLVFASTGLWFLYAMIVYFVVTKLTSALPAGLVLTAAIGVAVAGALLPIEEANRVSVLLHLVFFVLGARFPDLVRAAAGWRAIGALPILALGFVVASMLVGFLGLPAGIDVLVLSVLGLPAGVLLAVRASRAPRTAAAVAWVGRRTLPIYVLHIPVLGMLHHLGLSPALGPEWLALPLVTLYPLLVTTLVVAGALLTHAVLVRAGLGFLFQLPPVPRRRTHSWDETGVQMPSQAAVRACDGATSEVEPQSR